MNAHEHDMSADVLEPFVLEWAERARKAQEAVNAILAEQSTVPRIQRRRRRNKDDQWVLVRSVPRRPAGSEHADDDSPTGHAVTVNFTKAEWALIESAVLASHGLRPFAREDES